MKVILLQDVENLGKKFDVKEVADGYARNFLIFKNLAKPATSSALAEIEKLREREVQVAEEDLKLTQELASQIDGSEIEIKAKAGEDGKLFGSITPQKIVQVLEKQGYKIDKSQIKLESSIKEIGEYNISIGFNHGLEAQVKLIVGVDAEEDKIK